MKLKHIIVAIAGVIIGAGAGLFVQQNDPMLAVGGGLGTIDQLSQWANDGTYVTQNVANTLVKLTGYESSGDCLVTDASGVVSTSTCGAGGGSGTVTSVAQTVPTGFTVSGSPITTSGTLAVGFDTGYSLPTDANQSNWNTAYGWGDHSAGGYLTTVDISANTNLAVTSPITLTGDNVGINQSLLSITESQISDLTHFIPSTLIADYSFTDNSTNWNTAFGWGDHSSVGYLTSSSIDTSAEIKSIVTDETGTGSLVFSTNPVFTTPNLGTPSTLVGTNITGTATGLTAGNVTTNANLTGMITSVGNAASLGSFTSANLSTALTDETGSGFAVFSASPTLTGTPILPATYTMGANSFIRSGAHNLTLTTSATSNATIPAGTNTLYSTLASSITSAQLLSSISNETGTGVAVFGTSPAFTTSITTPSTSFTAFAGATTLLTIGGTGASASLFMPSTLDTSSSITGAIRTSGGISAAKALNIGTTATIGGAITSGGVAVPTISSASTLTNKTLQGAAISGALTGTGAYIPVSLLNSGTGASASTYWRGDGTWGTPAGGGSPAGSDTHLQFNNSGAFGATEQTNDAVRWILDSPTYTLLVGTSSASNAKFEINNQDASSVRGNMRIIANSASGADYDIRLDSEDADIEFCDGPLSSAYCYFELNSVPSNNELYITPRNAAHTSFEYPALTVRRDPSSSQGSVAINAPFDHSPDGMLEVYGIGTIDNLLALNSLRSVTGGDVMTIDSAGLMKYKPNGAKTYYGDYGSGANVRVGEYTTGDTDVLELFGAAGVRIVDSVTTFFASAASGVATLLGTWDFSGATVDLPANSVTEADLKAVDTAVDEECLTYESTTGDFEWQSCGAGGLASTDIDTSAEIQAIVTDETGSGALVFGTSPTFTTSVNLPTGAINTATEIGDDIVTDAQILDSDQTETSCKYIENPVATDDLKSLWANKTANDWLLLEIWGESDQTVNFDLQVDDGTPADVNGTDISPAAGEAEDTSLSGDTTLAAGEELDLAITSVSGTPTWVSICLTYQRVD